MEDDEELDDEAGGRDILGEMEIAARIMITGGDEREDARPYACRPITDPQCHFFGRQNSQTK